MSTLSAERLAAALVLAPKVEGDEVFLFLGVGDRIIQECVATGSVGREARQLREGEAVVVTLENDEPFAHVTSLAPLTFWLDGRDKAAA